MITKRALLSFVLIGIVAIFAARGCWRRGQGAYLQSILWGSCAYTWSPSIMEQHRQKYAPIVHRYLLESRLWNCAGWSLIALNGLLLIHLLEPANRTSPD